MNSQNFNDSLNESFDSKKSGTSPICTSTDLETIFLAKNSALSPMDFLEEEADRFDEEEFVEKKIRRINSNCFLVSCRSETSEYQWNEFTTDI